MDNAAIPASFFQQMNKIRGNKSFGPKLRLFFGKLSRYGHLIRARKQLLWEVGER